MVILNGTAEIVFWQVNVPVWFRAYRHWARIDYGRGCSHSFLGCRLNVVLKQGAGHYACLG